MRAIFECIDGHTCGNPVRVVKKGGPMLMGSSIMDKRAHFIEEFDWIRKGLMFEPRGHDMMSGSILYPAKDPSNDSGVIYIETSGCLPMCGHGTIGLVTIAIEEGLIIPKKEGEVRLETPAGLVVVSYEMKGDKVDSVRLRNIPSFLYAEALKIHLTHIGEIEVDVAYGGNFYAIVDQQKNFLGIQNYTSGELVSMSRELREKINDEYSFSHPEDDRINTLTHVLWSGETLDPGASARNAVFYGEKAIDRSPCGTGTSARMAQWFSKGKLKVGDEFIHESIIGSQFSGRVEAKTMVGPYQAIVPSIEGWAKVTGFNRIIIDSDDDPFWEGFSVI